MEIDYLSWEYIKDINKSAIRMFDVKKQDRHELVSYSKLKEVETKCVSQEGDIFDKAARLIIDITRKHPFASGNRRTAFLAGIVFLNINEKYPNDTILEAPNPRVFMGIREGLYSHKEVKEWIKTGKIREFKRS